LYKNSPFDLKLIILDPKRVEFTAYHNLPHLYTPIIKEPKSAIKALNWAIQEMERRYEILSEHGQVNVSDYNKKVLAPALDKARKKGKIGDELTGIPPKMPYIVIIFDEYNDFMLSYPKEISPLITALTQKGRAAGIHLILATQRPDVKVITGTIKANIPARIALKTTSQIDSRTILDSSGAEDLLGNGDMLYMASDNPRLLRLQAPFISVEEIRAVVSHIKEYNLEFIPDVIDISKVKIGASGTGGDSETGDGGTEPEDDEDYMSAKDYVISTSKASTSSLQTAFRWGYNKAARIINDLEHFQVIGPARPGERYREILVGDSPLSDSSSEGETGTDKTVDDIFRT
jgi:S-DNA-T family DNA segregation ATPase FtsK/SpoIIIE